jgi:hypothetical protein
MDPQPVNATTVETAACVLDAAIEASSRPPLPPEELELRAGRRVVLERTADDDRLRLVAAGGEVLLEILVTDRGPVLRAAGSLTLEAPDHLTLEGRKVTVRGREGIEVVSGGDLQIEARGDLHSRARLQTITADLGDVKVKANDDVRLNGERVLVNCDEI